LAFGLTSERNEYRRRKSKRVEHQLSKRIDAMYRKHKYTFWMQAILRSIPLRMKLHN